MQIVREDINQFERNKDPKVSLGIGIVSEIAEMKRKLLEYYDEALSKIDDPRFQGVEEALSYTFELIDKLSIMKDENS